METIVLEKVCEKYYDKLERAMYILVLARYAKICEYCMDIFVINKNKQVYGYAKILFSIKHKHCRKFISVEEMNEYLTKAMQSIPEKCLCW